MEKNKQTEAYADDVDWKSDQHNKTTHILEEDGMKRFRWCNFFKLINQEIVI